MENHWIFPGMDILVDRQYRHWAKEGTQTVALSNQQHSGPLVTISRMMGSGGEDVADLVAGALGCHVYDHEIVQEIVKQTHIRSDLVDEVDEHSSSPVDRWLEALVTQEVFDFEDYRKALGDVLETLARLGPAVILGRGANFLPRPYPRLDVRIIASMDVRIARVMEHEQISEAAARTMIEKSDKERRKFTRRVYHQEWGDPHYDDLVIHTDLLAIKEAANLILGTLDELLRASAPNAEIESGGVSFATRLLQPNAKHRSSHSK
jgi:cytidylate kinase